MSVKTIMKKSTKEKIVRWLCAKWLPHHRLFPLAVPAEMISPGEIAYLVKIWCPGYHLAKNPIRRNRITDVAT